MQDTLSTNKSSLHGVTQNIKMAREYTCIGNYQTALVYYEEVLDQIKKYMMTCKDEQLLQWQRDYRKLEYEYRLVLELNTELEKIDPNAFVVMNSINDTKGGMIKKRAMNH